MKRLLAIVCAVLSIFLLFAVLLGPKAEGTTDVTFVLLIISCFLGFFSYQLLRVNKKVLPTITTKKYPMCDDTLLLCAEKFSEYGE